MTCNTSTFAIVHTCSPSNMSVDRSRTFDQETLDALTRPEFQDSVPDQSETIGTMRLNLNPLTGGSMASTITRRDKRDGRYIPNDTQGAVKACGWDRVTPQLASLVTTGGPPSPTHTRPSYSPLALAAQRESGTGKYARPSPRSPKPPWATSSASSTSPTSPTSPQSDSAVSTGPHTLTAGTASLRGSAC